MDRPKKGCEGCRSRKKKCDKIFPRCARCVHLHIVCEWPQAGPTLHERRVGLGSIKSRQTQWTPAPILPAAPIPEMAESNQETSDAASGLTTRHEAGLASNAINDDEDDLWSTLGFDSSFTVWPAISGAHADISTWIPDAFSFVRSQEMDIFGAGGSMGPAFPEVAYPIVRPLPAYHISLPNSLILNVAEHQALAHYETVFSLYRATKDPQWSTHKVLLRLGSHNAMVMHFVLAVSLNDFSARTQHNASSQEAQSHFEAGAQLLIQANQNNGSVDHIAMMSSFFFLYLYMLNRNSVAPQRLRQLSMTVLDYVKSHDLRAGASGTSSSFTSRDGSLLARLIIWMFHEDLKCGFQRSGGYLAKYLTDNRNETANIYDTSRNALELQWGEEYPDTQVIDDMINSDVLEFLYAMMPLHQDINELCQGDTIGTPEMKSSVEQRLSALEKRFSSTFRLSATLTEPRTRLLINADFDVVMFNALRIYYFRSTIEDLGIETPSNVRASLKTLLSIVQRTFTPKGTKYNDRLQWPLFLAGIETDDGIYREWIMSTMTSGSVLMVLRRTLDAQRASGMRLTMTEIRDMFSANEELPSGEFQTGWAGDFA